MAAEVLVQDVSLDFRLYHFHTRSIRQTVVRSIAGRLGENENHQVVVQALRDINFRLRPGDRLGLIGGNGAGKTTLLRTLAGIYEPNRGRVYVRGVISSLLEPSLSINMDLTGFENITLRGLHHRMSPSAIQRMQDDVAEFADLGDFLNLPVRVYSAGMIVRLGFAITTAMRPQVLLMDEWFLAGDANFIAKARARLEDVVRGAEILVLSSHDAPIMQQWCTRVLWLQQGRILMDGPPDEVLRAYLGPENADKTLAAAEPPEPIST